MSMYYANNEHNKLIHISQSERGLNCNCTCIACGEILVAKKGKIMEHHFSHASLKESCSIHPESLLHRYGKEVIQRHQHITLPENTSFIQQSGNVYLQLNHIQTEQSIENIRPDITANITNGAQQKLHIELLVTHSVSDEKSAIIAELKLNTVEIDLTPLLIQNIFFPSEEAENFILNEISNKRWIYPQTPPRDILTIPTTPNKSIQAFPNVEYGTTPKSELFKYVMQILQDNLYLYAPHHPEWNNSISPITFTEVYEENLQFKPHLTGILRDHYSVKCKKIYIYLSENGQIDSEMLRWIDSLNWNTILIDLSDITNKNIHFPSPQADKIILENFQNKKWLRFKPFW